MPVSRVPPPHRMLPAQSTQAAKKLPQLICNMSFNTPRAPGAPRTEHCAMSAPLATPVDSVLPGVCPDTLQEPATDQGVPLPAAAAASTGVSAAGETQEGK